MEEQNIIEISVIWRGNQLNLEIDPKCNIKEFGKILLDLTNVKPDTLKLLVPINKSSKLVTPFSDSHSSLSLQDIGIIEGKEIRMLGVFENEIEEVSENDKRPNLRIIGFEDEEKRHKNRSFANRPQTSLKLPKGPYTFCDFRTLTLPGIQLNPPSSEALKRMHMLACDPGIIAIMNKYKWRVGIMTEMAPVGYVGISPKCILGFNKNKGEEISLRLRTDDLKGFRKYESIKKTLLHELAHMVHSEHDADFFALDKQLNEEAVRLNWTKSTGHTLNGHKNISSYEEEFLFELNNNNKISNKLGGEINSFVSPRASSINAAYKRLINSFNEKYEPDPDELKPDSDNLNNILSINEPDPDDNNKPNIDNNLNDILSINEPDPDDNKPDIDNNLNDILSINEPDPDDNNKPDIDNNLNDILSINEPDPDDNNKPDIDNNLNNIITINEPDPDENNEPDFDNLNDILGINENTKEIIMAEPDPDESVTKETMINNELDLVHEHQNIKPNSDEDFIMKSDPDIMLIEEPGVVFCSKVQNIIQNLKSELTAQEASSVLQTLSKIIRNVIEHPNDAKFRKLRKANPHLQRNVANYTGAMEVLKMVGFNEEIIGDETYLVLKRNDPGLLWLAKSSLEVSMA